MEIILRCILLYNITLRICFKTLFELLTRTGQQSCVLNKLVRLRRALCSLLPLWIACY